MLVSNLKEAFPSYNIIIKLQIFRSLGLLMDFGEDFRQTTPLGLNTETLYAIPEI